MLRRYTSLYTQQISTHSCVTLFLGMASRIQLYCADDVASFSLSRLHVDALPRYDNTCSIVAHDDVEARMLHDRTRERLNALGVSLWTSYLTPSRGNARHSVPPSE